MPCRFAAAALACSLSTLALSQQPLTAADVSSRNTGTPPSAAAWSPDSRLLTFLSSGEADLYPPGAKVGAEGDLLQLEAATGTLSVLATAAELDQLEAGAVNEKDGDHRSRYGMASYLWSDDNQHLLLDKGGRLWLWDTRAHKGTLVVDTRTGSGDDPKFSPDGRLLSYLHDDNLYVHPVAAGAETALTAIPAGTPPNTVLNGGVDWLYLEELNVRTNYAWAPDSTSIAYLQSDESRVPLAPIQDFLPTHNTVDWQRFPQPGDPNPAVRVGVVAATGGPTTWLQVPLSSGNDYIPRFGWVDGNTVWVEVLARDQQHRAIYLADRRTGAAHLLWSETDAKYLEADYDLTFLAHGRLLLKSWRDGHMHLYLYSFDGAHPLSTTATLTRQLTHGDFEVYSVAVPSPTGEIDRVLAITSQGSPLEQHLWSLPLDGSAGRELTPAAGVHRVLSSPDGRFFTDQVSTLHVPPAVTLCRTENSSCSPLWHSRTLPEDAGVTRRIQTFRAADGTTTLYGTLTLPSAATGSHTVPVILNPYGGPLPTGPGVLDEWSGFSTLDSLLGQHGYAVLALDNRGSGGRGRDFEQANFRNFGPVQLADQLAAVDQLLASDPRLDPDRIGWWGWSWGGFFTTYAMTHSSRIRAGFAVAPGSTDLRNYDTAYTERYMGLPDSNKEAYQASNTNAVAARLHGRILLAHGTGDDNVHLENSMQFVQALIQANLPYDLQLFPRLTHSLAGKPARTELFSRLLEHFDTWLKPTVPPRPQAAN